MPYVFGYGSLMWAPRFPYDRRTRAVLPGHHRDFTMAFPREWGSEAGPCPVLGLEPGGRCVGVLYRIEAGRAETILRDLAAFEGKAYAMRTLGVQGPEGRVEAAVAVNRRDHPTYIGDRSRRERARMIREAAGEEGSCRGYLKRVARALEDLGAEDAVVRSFLALVER